MRHFRKFKLKKVNIDDIDDRTLMLNLYVTQMFTLLLGVIIIFFQPENPLSKLFVIPKQVDVLLWGTGFSLLVILINLLISRIVPEEVADDGGVNERIFKHRALWHIVVICFIVAVCEEVLFRGAIQHVFGPYWTSILFAAIHVRYLRHWLMTGLVFVVSYGLGWIYIQTGTLWTPILAHFIIDLVMGCIIRYRREP